MNASAHAIKKRRHTFACYPFILDHCCNIEAQTGAKLVGTNLKGPLMEMAKVFGENPQKLSDSGSKKQNSRELDFFHTAVWPIFMVAQVFAIMPLNNISSPNPSHVKFKYGSLSCIATGVFLFLGSIMFIFFADDIMQGGVNAINFVQSVFFFCGLFACTLFARLATRWPLMIRRWTQVEIVFLGPPYEATKWSLRWKIRLSAFFIAVLCAVEHGLFYASDIYGYRMQKSVCNETQIPASFEDYIRIHFAFIFSHIPYNIFFTIPLLFLNSTFTFIWNYMDLFIVLISLGLATRFQQIGERTQALSGKIIDQDIWYEIRCHYVQLCELLEMVDDELSSLILLSSANNLYFICYQIFNIFNTLRWPINYIYFWYFLLYLIGETVFLFLCASKINAESKVPLKALRLIPAEGWGNEAERFSAHITEDFVALSAKRLFFITRKLVFGMAATILTYELVLLQIDELNTGRDLPPLCV